MKIKKSWLGSISSAYFAVLLSCLFLADTYYAITSCSSCAQCTAMGSDPHVMVPNNVLQLVDYAFSNCRYIESVVGGESLQTVGEYAFEGCTSLTSVQLNNVSTIGEGAFIECESLSTVTLLEATSIGFEAFTALPNLISVTMPSVTTIDDSAFNACELLASVNINAVLSVGEYAFEECTSLIILSMPFVTNIGAYAFGSCGQLQTVVFPLDEAVTVNIAATAFSSCVALSCRVGSSAVLANAAFASLPTLTCGPPSFVPTYMPTAIPTTPVPSLPPPTAVPSYAVTISPNVQPNLEYIITTFAGTGNTTSTASQATLSTVDINSPQQMWEDTTNQLLYIVEYANCVVRRVNMQTSIVLTFAGEVGVCQTDGDGASTLLSHLLGPVGVVGGSNLNIANSNFLYISQFDDCVLRVVDLLSSGTIISTIAGTSGVCLSDGDGGAASSANLLYPYGLAVDNTAQNLYVVEHDGHKVRRLTYDSIFDTLVIDTVVGTGSGVSLDSTLHLTAGSLLFPRNIWIDSLYNMYITEENKIRKILLFQTNSSNSGPLITIAGTGQRSLYSNTSCCGDGSLAVEATFHDPRGIWVSSATGNVFITDTDNHKIRMIDVASGVIITVAGEEGKSRFAGDGSSALQASLSRPKTILGNKDESVLYIADGNNHRIRALRMPNPSSEPTVLPSLTPTATPTATSSPSEEPSSASSQPTSSAIPTVQPTIAPSAAPNTRELNLIISTFCGTGIETFSGDDGLASNAAVNHPYQTFIDSHGAMLYIADYGNARIRMVNLETNKITTFAGGGAAVNGDNMLATSVKLSSVVGVFGDSIGSIYISQYSSNKVRVVNTTTGMMSTLVGLAGTASSTGNDGPAVDASVSRPYYLAVDTEANVYIPSFNHQIVRKVTFSTGIISLFAGTTGVPGTVDSTVSATLGTLTNPTGVYADTLGNLYISDYGGAKVRKVRAGGGSLMTIAGTGTSGSIGDGGAATLARLSGPLGLWVSSATGDVFIADSSNHKIRMVDIAQARQDMQNELLLSSSTTSNSTTSSNTSSEEAVEIHTGLISTVAGTGNPGSDGDGGLAVLTEFEYPIALIADSSEISIYISDENNNRIRYSLLPSRAPTAIPTTTVPSIAPTAVPSIAPTAVPSIAPTAVPSPEPTAVPSAEPTAVPTAKPTAVPSAEPTAVPSIAPTAAPFAEPTAVPSAEPTAVPSTSPTVQPSLLPSAEPSYEPSASPSICPSVPPSTAPSVLPSAVPTDAPSGAPTVVPSVVPSTMAPTATACPSTAPTLQFSVSPSTSALPSASPSTAAPSIPPPALLYTIAGNGQYSSSTSSSTTNIGDNGLAEYAVIDGPYAVATDLLGERLFIAEAAGCRVRVVNMSSRMINTIAGNGLCVSSFSSSSTAAAASLPSSSSSPPSAVSPPQTTAAAVSSRSSSLSSLPTTTTTTSDTVSIFTPSGVWLHDPSPSLSSSSSSSPSYVPSSLPTSCMLYISEQGGNKVLVLDLSTYDIYAFVGASGVAGYSGDGELASDARLKRPGHIHGSGVLGLLYVADTGNHAVRVVNITKNGEFSSFNETKRAIFVIKTVAGDGSGVSGYSGDSGPATAAKLTSPIGVFVDSSARLFIADSFNHRIRMVDTAGIITTVIGTGRAGLDGTGGAATAALLNTPVGLLVMQNGDIYFSELFNHVVRYVSHKTGIVELLAGVGGPTYTGDGTLAEFSGLNAPAGICLLSNRVSGGGGGGVADGEFIISDSGSRRVRMVSRSVYTNSPVHTPTASPTRPTIPPDSSHEPSAVPSISTMLPSTVHPSSIPSSRPSTVPSSIPTISHNPTSVPSSSVPTITYRPSYEPTFEPSAQPSSRPTAEPSSTPTSKPSSAPSLALKAPSVIPTLVPATAVPSCTSSNSISNQPTLLNTISDSSGSSSSPTGAYLTGGSNSSNTTANYSLLDDDDGNTDGGNSARGSKLASFFLSFEALVVMSVLVAGIAVVVGMIMLCVSLRKDKIEKENVQKLREQEAQERQGGRGGGGGVSGESGGESSSDGDDSDRNGDSNGGDADVESAVYSATHDVSSRAPD